jgi:hypothetical protein
MKYKMLLPLLIFMLSCGLFNRPSTVEPVAPVVDFNQPGDPIDVTVELDQENSTSGIFSTNGSAMSLTAADGTVFTLEVPAGALDVDTPITMTVVKNIDGAPLNEEVFAVQLEPSGLTFNEIVTLTIQPAQEIPIDEQIIFGYEGSGEDYHLAVVDPYSPEIKIKLMNFSGAGVGSGSDAQWAATLKSTAEGSRERFVNKFGEVTQTERQKQLLGQTDDESPSDLSKTIESLYDQFYDQVLLKEIAAAELDCRYAKKALHDLIFVERNRQLLGLSTDEASKTVDFQGKFKKLLDMAKKCKKGYSASGSGDGITFSGSFCGTVDTPFTLTGTIDGGTVTFNYRPVNEKSGNFNYSGGAYGFTTSGQGTYKVSGSSDGPLTLVQTSGGCVDEGGCKNTTETITLTPMESCGQ